MPLISNERFSKRWLMRISVEPSEDLATVDTAPRGPGNSAGLWRWTAYAATRALAVAASVLVALPLIGRAYYVWQDAGLNEGITLSSAFMSGAALSYAVAAGMGAWIAHRERKLGLDQLTGLSVFPSDRSRLATLGGTSLALVLPVVVAGVIVDIGMLASPHRVGTLSVASVLATAFMVALWIPVGYLCGHVIRHFLVVPLVAIAAWLLPSLAGGGQGTPVSMLLPAISPGGSPFTAWNGAVMWAQLLWFAGLWCLLAGVLTYRRHAPSPVITALLGVASGLVGFLMMAHLDFARFVPTAVNGAPIENEQCGGSSPTICLHPAFEGLRPELTETFRSLMQKLAGTPGFGETVEQRPRGVGQEPSPGAAAFFLDYARPTDSHLARGEYIEGLLQPEACFATDPSASLPWTSIVYQWLTDSLADPAGDAQYAGAEDQAQRQAAREHFLSLTESERHAWFVAHYDGFVTCSLRASDFKSS